MESRQKLVQICTCPHAEPEESVAQAENAILCPPENGPEESAKESEKCCFEACKYTFRVFALIDFGGPCPGGQTWLFLDFEMNFLKFPDFGFCMGSGRLQGQIEKKEQTPHCTTWPCP